MLSKKLALKTGLELIHQRQHRPAILWGIEEPSGESALSVDFFGAGETVLLCTGLRLRLGEGDRLEVRLRDLHRRFLRSRLSLLERLFFSFLFLNLKKRMYHSNSFDLNEFDYLSRLRCFLR